MKKALSVFSFAFIVSLSVALLWTVLSLPVYADSASSSEPLYTEEELTALYSSQCPPDITSTYSRSATSTTITLFTTDNTPVTADIYADISDTERNRRHQASESECPGIERLAPATNLYNCHSYAWYNASTSNTYWIGSPEAFISDLHTETVTLSNLQSGDIVVYSVENCYAHSAIVDYIDEDGTIYCISKWGGCALYRHAIDNVPFTYLDNGELNVTYYRYEQGEHDYITFSSDSQRHIYECSICSNSYAETHTILYTSIDSSKHVAACSVCNYSITNAHNITYINVNGSNHRVTCTVCHYSKLEAHALNNQKTYCVKCLRTDGFTVIARIEDIEKMGAKTEETQKR